MPVPRHLPHSPGLELGCAKSYMLGLPLLPGENNKARTVGRVGNGCHLRRRQITLDVFEGPRQEPIAGFGARHKGLAADHFDVRAGMNANPCGFVASLRFVAIALAVIAITGPKTGALVGANPGGGFSAFVAIGAAVGIMAASVCC